MDELKTLDDLIRRFELREPAQQKLEAPDQYMLECQRGERRFDFEEYYWEVLPCANFCRGRFSGKRD